VYSRATFPTALNLCQIRSAVLAVLRESSTKKDVPRARLAGGVNVPNLLMGSPTYHVDYEQAQ